MKLRFILLMTILSHSLYALDFDLEMGTGLFYTGAKGKIDYVEESFQGSYANTALQTSGQFYIWGDLDTHIEYWPKMRFEYLHISADGDSTAHLESSIQEIQELIEKLAPLGLNDKTWNSHLQHNIFDFTLYYEYFEKSAWPSLGLGLGYKYFNYIYIMDIDLVPGLQFGDRDDSGAPLLFFTSRYEATSMNMGFQADGKVYVFGDSEMYDWQVKMDLMFPLDEKTTAGLEFGYRDQFFHLQGDDVEKVTGNMRYKGLFVGAVITFK